MQIKLDSSGPLPLGYHGFHFVLLRSFQLLVLLLLFPLTIPLSPLLFYS